MLGPPLVILFGFAVLAAIVYFAFASFLFGAGYQPAPRRVVDRMLDAARVSPSDVLYDLGAGTGAILFRAARDRGAHVVGVEVEPLRVLILRWRRWFGGPRDRIVVRWGNLFGLDFGAATVVAVFLWPDAMARLKPLFEAQLHPGARVVSHWHPVPGWTADSFDRSTRVYLYLWPQAAGASPPGS